MMVRVGALVTLELPADSPALSMPWIITFGPARDDEEWDAVVCGPYERAHALALAEEIVADEDVMAVVEPLTPYLEVEKIREEIVASRELAEEADADEDTDVDVDLADEEEDEYEPFDEEDGEEESEEEDDEDLEEDEDFDEDEEDDEEDDEEYEDEEDDEEYEEEDEADEERPDPPSPEEVRAGIVRIAARLAEI